MNRLSPDRDLRRNGYLRAVRPNHRYDRSTSTKNIRRLDPRTVRCCICTRPLHDLESKKRGMGLDCMRKTWSQYHGVCPGTVKRPSRFGDSSFSDNMQDLIPKSDSIAERSARFFIGTPLGRSLLLNGVIHALSPIPGVAPVVIGYDIYRAYKYARLGNSIYNCYNKWKSSNETRYQASAMEKYQEGAVDYIMEKSEDKLMNFSKTAAIELSAYTTMFKNSLTESAKHGFNEFAGFTLS